VWPGVRIHQGETMADKIHGEGNYKASKDFDDAETAFVKSGRVEEAARAAAPKTKAEEEEMKRAEAEARTRSKGEDPSLADSSKKKDSTQSK
jgi:hypothetical protein